MNEAALGEIQPSEALMQFAYETLKVVRVAAQGCTASSRAIHADLSQPEAGRHVAASEISFKLCQRALPLVDKSSQSIAAEITKLETRIKAPAVDNTIRAVQVATEFRLFLRDQSSADRRKTIMKCLESANDQILSAILSAPPCLSGLSESEVSSFALMWRQRKYPSELKRIAQLEKALAAVQLGGTLLVSHQQKMAAPAIVAEAKKFREASRAAVREATGAH
ncbi:MAG: hypothetical protein M3178_16350 [Pseudomonadota bacterium]|nr:hypothetical protein [Pseudomonadota bacterium]